MKRLRCVAAALIAGLLAPIALSPNAVGQSAPAAQGPLPPIVLAPQLSPAYVADLTNAATMAQFKAVWRNMDANIVETAAMPNAGPQWKSAYDVQPKAGAAEFDDRAWPIVEPKSLLDRRGGGYLYMTWFRTTLTVPDKIGAFDPTGTWAIFTMNADDYAEVWVNGKLQRAPGQPSPGAIQGFNIPNRVVISQGVKPGDRLQIAMMVINGPISAAPPNPIYVREAHVDFVQVQVCNSCR